MCGIAGILGFGGRPVLEQEVRLMCDAMVHRGPDDEGIHIEPGVGLGMRRLSIIDLESGRQPVHNEDRTIWVVFNGEIYNFKHLRSELEQLGHVFYTASDTEVIVHLYEQYGEACVDRMRGMFAFAIWDSRNKRLLLARDRLGIKPLYYGVVDGRLVFGSELKVILSLEEVSPELNWTALSHYLSSMCTPVDESIVRGVHKLKPGHLLSASPSRGVEVRKYWDVTFEPDESRTEEYFVERLRDLLAEAVRLRMISDVPLGAFLSGGVDSSAVVAMMSRFSNAPVKTFSIGFEDKDFDETEYAREVAARFRTEHHELIVAPDVLGVIDDLAWYLDEPFGDSSAIPTYMVSKMASDSVTVVVSGDGGDELFSGYDRYVVEQRERRYSRIPAPLRRGAGLIGRAMPQGMKGKNFLTHLSYDGIDRYVDANLLFKPEEKSGLLTPEAFRQIADLDPERSWRLMLGSQSDWLSSLQYADMKVYLPNDILTKVDRMSMAHSIEARVPLLDHKLVEFAATIPAALRLRGKDTKYIFKRALEGILPDSILYRQKRGFAVPLSRWFRGNLNGFVRDLLLDSTSRQRGIINPQYVESLLALNDRGRPMDMQIWTLITLELWCRRFMDQSSAGSNSLAAVS